MVFSNKDNEVKMVIVNCNCGCEEAISIKKYTYDDDCQDDEYYLSVLACKYYSNQRGIFKTILHRLNLAWKMLIGKEYRLNEIVIKKSEFDEFKKKLKEL